jgi:hypothetical protein
VAAHTPPQLLTATTEAHNPGILTCKFLIMNVHPAWKLINGGWQTTPKERGKTQVYQSILDI